MARMGCTVCTVQVDADQDRADGDAFHDGHPVVLGAPHSATWSPVVAVSVGPVLTVGHVVTRKVSAFA